MDLIGELHDLQQKALLFATETDRDKRHAGGRWLERECYHLDNRYRIMDGFNEEAKIELSAIVTIIFEYMLYDCLEDPDWAEAMPTSYDGDLNAILQGMRG